MARKGFWQRLFGGGEPPEDGPKSKGADDAADDPTSWHEDETKPADATDAEAETEDKDAPADEGATDREALDETEMTRPDEPGGAEEDTDDSATRPDKQSGESEADDADPETPGPAPGSEAPETPANSETILPQTAELKTDAVGRVYAQSLIELAAAIESVEIGKATDMLFTDPNLRHRALTTKLLHFCAQLAISVYRNVLIGHFLGIQ